MHLCTTLLRSPRPHCRAPVTNNFTNTLNLPRERSSSTVQAKATYSLHSLSPDPLEASRHGASIPFAPSRLLRCIQTSLLLATNLIGILENKHSFFDRRDRRGNKFLILYFRNTSYTITLHTGTEPLALRRPTIGHLHLSNSNPHGL